MQKFFRHLSHAKKCKESYGDERYNVIKKERRKDIDRVSRAEATKWASFDDLALEQKIAEENGDNWEQFHENGLILKCEGCDESYFTDTFFKHISHSKRCKEILGEEKFESMKKEKRKMVRHQNYKNNEVKYKEKAKIYHSKNKKTRNDRKKEKYNEERQEILKELEIKKKEEAVKSAIISRKHARDDFEKYSRHELALWKNCRNKDINKFEATNVREDLSTKISTLTFELNETVREFEKKIDNIVLSTKEMNEMKEIKSLHNNFRSEFRNHHTKVDNSFKEMAAILATRILCFQCIYMKSVGGLFECDGSGCDESSKSEKAKESSKTTKNSVMENKNDIRKRKAVTVEKEVENNGDDDFKIEVKKKKPKKSEKANDELTSQSKDNLKNFKKKPKKTPKNLALDYDSADDFQVEPNLKKTSNPKGSNVDFKVKPVPYKNNPKKQIDTPKDNSNPLKITFTIKTKIDLNKKLKPKFKFSKIQKD